MDTQRVFQVGNSNVVAIPKSLMRELKLKTGQKVTVGRLPDSDDIVIKTKSPQRTQKTGLTPEFKKWLDRVVERDREIIKALAEA